MVHPPTREIQERLLDWFDAGHRDMPWRRTKDPYRILVAEYLLQRTRVASGEAYYERFLERFPDVSSLAAASGEDVLRAWEGLGFYRRARNLHEAAKAIVRDHDGRIPSGAETLATLPGIGPYTAGAVASIAFGERVAAVDGNVTRVVSRLVLVDDDVTGPRGRSRIQELAGGLVPAERPGAFNQAMMELGATVCTPRNPRCPVCPLREICAARGAGVEASLPRMRAVRRPKTAAVGFAYLLSRKRVLLVRRPDSELLGGLWSLPGGEVPMDRPARVALRELVSDQTGLHVDVLDEVAPIAHAFSHRRWSGAVFRCIAHGRLRGSVHTRWVTLDEARRLPLVPIHRKILDALASQPHLESLVPSARKREK